VAENYFIYGAGNLGGQAASMLLSSGNRLLAWIDADDARAGQERCGAFIYGIETFPDDHESSVVVAVAHGFDEIRASLVTQGVDEKRILPFGVFMVAMAKSLATMLPSAGAVAQKDEADIYLCLSHGFPLGGIEAFCVELYERLTRMGHRVKFLCLAEPYAIPSSVRKDVITFPQKDGFAENVRQALQFLKGVRDKIVVINYLRPVELAAVALQNTRSFRILSILHSDSESVYRNNVAFAPSVYAFVGVSDLACRHMIEAGVEPARVYSTTLPITGPDALTRSYAKEEEPIRIGYAGRIVKSPKRLDLQLELIHRLESEGIAYEYHFMGSGTYEDDVRAFIKHEGIDDHVLLHPPCPRTKIGAFWQQMDVCISTSIWEGRGISILEAMMWGAVPVITETAGAHQDIDDGRSGYIVPIGDIDAMAGRVLELAQHRDRLPVMGRNAYERVRKYGDFEAFDALWRELL